MDPDSEVQHDFHPFIQQYKSGRVVRFGTADTVPAGTDTAGRGVSSKDVVINPSTGLWVRLYLPPLPAGRRDKIPVVVYYHGGAFVIGSTAHRPTHLYLNSLAADANVLVVSTEYRLAPEHPLPTAHDDSWEGLKWVASHATGEGAEPWLAEHGDLSRVFVAGGSAGGNIAHNVAARAGAHRLGVAIRGLLVVHPYFNWEAGVGGQGLEGVERRVLAVPVPRHAGAGRPAVQPVLGGSGRQRGAGRRRARARLRRREGRAPGQGRLVLREPEGQWLSRRGGTARVRRRGARLPLPQLGVRASADVACARSTLPP
uniref:Alpha/beta hydrolase fold-3 domain-containing protein n=1 Tax=Arundo donax TaxID=35708 RepID=A0A0A9BF06_ARUDO